MGWLAGGEGGVGEHEGHESYLWVVSVDAGVAGGGPVTGAFPRAAMAAACGGGPARGGWGGMNPRPGRSWGASWHGAGPRAARGERQHGGGDGAMNEHGNSWNTMEHGEHELQQIERSRF